MNRPDMIWQWKWRLLDGVHSYKMNVATAAVAAADDAVAVAVVVGYHEMA